MDNLTKKPHIHAEAIKAWAHGATIECYINHHKAWFEIGNPSWYEDMLYRIKEAEKPDKIMEVLIVLGSSCGPMLYAAAPDKANCKLVFDGTTGKLTGAAPIQASEALKQPSEAFSNSSEGLGSLNPFKRTGEL